MMHEAALAPTRTQWIRLAEGADAYVAAPDGREALGGVIVAGEIFGITAHVRGICERLAGAGYLTMAPDFYWRQQRGICLTYGADGRTEGLRMLRLLRREEVVADVAAAQAHLAAQLGVSKAMAIVGVSAGGHIAFLAATRLRFALAVSIYGGWMVDGGIPLAKPRPPAADCAALAAHGCFFLGVVGDRDRLISAEQWRRLGGLLRAAGVRHELVRYAGASHGFLCAERAAAFDVEASADVWRRLLDALALHVGNADARSPRQRVARPIARARHPPRKARHLIGNPSATQPSRASNALWQDLNGSLGPIHLAATAGRAYTTIVVHP